jgi:hypothetical protein
MLFLLLYVTVFWAEHNFSSSLPTGCSTTQQCKLKEQEAHFQRNGFLLLLFIRKNTIF